jgi:hypothetical protein
MLKKSNIMLGLSILLVCSLGLFFVRLIYLESFVQDKWIADHWYNPKNKSTHLDIPYTFKASGNSDSVYNQGDFSNFLQMNIYDSYHPFFDPVTQQIYQSSREQILQHRVSNQTRLQTFKNDKQKIPNLIHCFWYSETYSTELLEQWRKYFEQHSNFKIACWFFGKGSNSVINQIRRAFSGLVNILYLDLDAHDAIQYAVDLFDIYYHYRKTQPLIELVAYNLIYKYGGIYVNNYHVPIPLTPELLNLDYFASQNGGVITTSLLASKPKSIVYHQHLLLLEDLYRYEPFIQSLTLPSDWLNPWSSSLGITLAMDQWLASTEVFLPISHPGSTEFWKKGLIETNDKIKINYTLTRKKIPNVGFYAGEYDDRHMMERFGIDIFKYFASIDGISMEQYNENRKRIEDTFFKNIYNIQTPRQENIPRIIHRIWLTKDRELNTDQLQCIKKTYDLLHPHWYSIFWTNNLSAIPQSIQFLKQECPDLEIRNIHDFDLPFGNRVRNIFDAFMKEKRYANAKDLLATSIIYKYGGLCIDLGVFIEQDFTDLIDNYEIAFYYHFTTESFRPPPDWYDTHIEIPIIGGKKNSELFQRWLNDLEMAKYKQYNKTYFATPGNQLVFTGTEYLAYMLNAYFSHSKVLFLPNHFYVNRAHHLDSWVGSINKSKIDLWNF